MQITFTSKLSNYTTTIQSLSFFSPFLEHKFILCINIFFFFIFIFSVFYAQSNHMQNQEMNYSTNKTIPQKGGVIISVYVETPIKQTNNCHQNPNPLKNTNPNAPPKTPKSRGYDRRAQLLAYSRELRNIDSSTTQLPKTKSKKWKWNVKPETGAVRRRLPSRRVLQRWRYERVGIRREERTEVVDQRCLPKCFNGSNKKTSIFRKLKSLLMGELSKGCKRGGDH